MATYDDDRIPVSESAPQSILSDLPSDDFVGVAAHFNSSYAISSDGQMLVWGQETAGMLGVQAPSGVLKPTWSSLTSVAAAAPGYGSWALLLRDDGTVVGLGEQCVVFNNLRSGVEPVTIVFPGDVQVTAVAAGAIHALALDAQGAVWSWGYNSSGQLGDGGTNNRYLPYRVEGLPKCIAVAAGRDHSLALAEDGHVWRWGARRYTADYNVALNKDSSPDIFVTPSKVGALSAVVAIASKWCQSLALCRDGTVYAWGSNRFGELGDGTRETRTEPVQVKDLSGIVRLSSGMSHSLAVDENGRLWGWGHADFGELGSDERELPRSGDQLTPVCLSNMPQLAGRTVLDMAAGHQTLVLTAPKEQENLNSIWAFGWNGFGGVGDGTTSSRCIPHQVAPLEPVNVEDPSLISSANARSILVLGTNKAEHLATSFPFVGELWNLYEIAVGDCEFEDLSPELLHKFQVVLLVGLSRLDPLRQEGGDTLTISQSEFDRVTGLLLDFVQQGGGLYVYGVEFGSAGDSWASATLNRFLEKLDAQVCFERISDPTREERQSGGMMLHYALANEVADHPATDDVRSYWYPVDFFSFGPFTRPLALGESWTPLIRASGDATLTPLQHNDKGTTIGETPSGEDSRAAPIPPVIYACRSYGSGRVVLNGGECTASFFGHHYSPHAQRLWGYISMEAGLNGTPSHGLELLLSSLKWVSEPARTLEGFGGFTMPDLPPPERIAPATFGPREQSLPVTGYCKGLFAVIPAEAGGASTVEEYAAEARRLELDYIVFACDFEGEGVNESTWETLVAACEGASSTAEPHGEEGSPPPRRPFLAVPALLTRDEVGNSFLQCGSKSWPRSERLSSTQPKRLREHLYYWMSDSNWPLRAPWRLSRGHYPAWLFGAYSALAVRTWEFDQERGQFISIEDNTAGLIECQQQGDGVRPISVTVVKSLDQLAHVPEHTFLRVPDTGRLLDAFLQQSFMKGWDSFVSSGPQITYWVPTPSCRYTAGELYVSGSERFRLYLGVASAADLKSVTIWDGETVLRRYEVSGSSCEIVTDLLLDRRRILTAVVEDVLGGKALSGTWETPDLLFRQYLCSDRCNLMVGEAMIRESVELPYSREPATCNLNKSGQLYFNAPARVDVVPGFDQSGAGANHFHFVNYGWIFAKGTDSQEADPALSEMRSPVHQIRRPYESADVIIFDTPVPKRTARDYTPTSAHYTARQLEDSHVEFRVVQHHFYRRAFYPSPMIADLSMTVVHTEGIELIGHSSWRNFSRLYTEANRGRSCMVLRTDGTVSRGPVSPENRWQWSGILQPGDSILIPEQGEGFFLLEGDLGIDIDCWPGRTYTDSDGNVQTQDSFRLWTGTFDTGYRPYGNTHSARILCLKLNPDDAIDDETTLKHWRAFADAFGLGGASPAYTLDVTRGHITSQCYLLELVATELGFQGRINQAPAMPQRLPIRITGLGPRWTAAKIDLERNEWSPLGVTEEGVAYTTIDLREGDHHLYIGNVVSVDHPDVFATLLPANQDGMVYLEVHNPTDQSLPITARILVSFDLRVLEGTVRVRQQTLPSVKVPAGSSLRASLVDWVAI